MDIDDLFYGILRAINGRWVERISLKEQEGETEIEGDVQRLKLEIEQLRNTVMMLQMKIIHQESSSNHGADFRYIMCSGSF